MKKILLGLISLMFLGSGLAYAGEGPYTNSAHGSSTSGVERTDYPTALEPYAQGNCAHCHEQHASIGGTQPDPKETTPAPSKFCLLADNFSGKAENLYAQSDNACFYCHCKATATTYQTTAFDNYSYSRTFGGNPDATPASIMDAFNITSGSYHNLKDILDFAKGEWTSTYTSNSNPCVPCHNPHIARRVDVTLPGLNSAITRPLPTERDNVWGDDVGTETETMYEYASAKYQAPYYHNGSITNQIYEPKGDGIYDYGSNLTDYVTFCQDCHTTQMYTSPYAFGLTNTPINWATTGGESGGDKHGKNVATDTSGANINLREPYLTAWTTSGLVLACTDCHEPHGAQSVMLIRKEINGTALPNPITTIVSPDSPYGAPDGSTRNTEFIYICNRCHTAGTKAELCAIHHNTDDNPYSLSSCSKCHYSHGSGMTCSSDATQISCTNCHFHGSDDNWAPSEHRTGRRTF